MKAPPDFGIEAASTASNSAFVAAVTDLVTVILWPSTVIPETTFPVPESSEVRVVSSGNVNVTFFFPVMNPCILVVMLGTVNVSPYESDASAAGPTEPSVITPVGTVTIVSYPDVVVMQISLLLLLSI